MEYIIYLLIVIVIYFGCRWSWKRRPRNRAKEYKDMFEKYRPPEDKGGK